MSDSDRLAGGLAPLFDRLRATKSVTEPQPLATLSPRELHESIRRELSGLLNVRSPLSADRFCDQQLTVFDYGIPDLTTLSLHRRDDVKRLCRIVTRAITAFEPRLTRVEITAVPLDYQAKLLLTCKANLANDQFSEPMYLTVTIPRPGGTGQVLNVELPPEL